MVGRNQIGPLRPALRKTCAKCKHAIHPKGDGKTSTCRMNIVINPGPHPDTIPCFCQKPVPMKEHRDSIVRHPLDSDPAEGWIAA